MYTWSRNSSTINVCIQFSKYWKFKVFLNERKCWYKANQLNPLEHTLTSSRKNKRIRFVQNARTPFNKEEPSSLGLIKYLGKFVPNFFSEPLKHILKKELNFRRAKMTGNETANSNIFSGKVLLPFGKIRVWISN